MTSSVRSLVIGVALASASGCVTTSTLVKRPDRVSLPLLLGAAAGDFLITTFAALELRDYSEGGSLATGIAVTAADVTVGCVLGGCAALRP
jgi:hypothetical protein